MSYMSIHFIAGEVVRQWPRRPEFNLRPSHRKDSKKWYWMRPCLTLSIIRCGSRVKWSNPGKGSRALPYT